MVPTEKADEYYREHVGREMVPPTSTSLAAHFQDLTGQVPDACMLHPDKVVSLFLGKNAEEDIAISGLGWVALNYMPVSYCSCLPTCSH